MSLAMFGIVAKQVTAIDVLNNAITGAASHQVASDAAQQTQLSVSSQWQALRAQFDPNLGMLSDDQATQYINALQNILNRLNSIIAQDGGVTVTGSTPYAVAGGSGGTGMGPDALIVSKGDYSKYVTPGTTSSIPQINPVFDPSKSGNGKTPVPVSTQDQIKSISDSIFGSIASGAKSFFEIKAMQQMARGQPVNVPSQAAIQASGAGISTGEKFAIGGVAVVGIGLLIFALARK